MGTAIGDRISTMDAAALVYCDLTGPGITRRGHGRGFSYSGPGGFPYLACHRDPRVFVQEHPIGARTYREAERKLRAFLTGNDAYRRRVTCRPDAGRQPDGSSNH